MSELPDATDYTATSAASTGGYASLPAAPHPRARAGARVAATVMVLLLAALATLLVQHVLFWWDLLATSWLVAALEWVQSHGQHTTAQVIAGATLLVLGVILLVGVWPRRQRGHRLTTTPALILSGADVARLSSAAAETVDGVLNATTSVTGQRVRVTVTATGSDPIAGAVETAVRDRLTFLDGRFRVSASVRTPAASAAIAGNASSSEAESIGGSR